MVHGRSKVNETLPWLKNTALGCVASWEFKGKMLKKHRKNHSYHKFWFVGRPLFVERLWVKIVGNWSELALHGTRDQRPHDHTQTLFPLSGQQSFWEMMMPVSHLALLQCLSKTSFHLQGQGGLLTQSLFVSK